MPKRSLAVGAVLGAATISILSAAIGFAFGVDTPGDDLNKNVIPLLSMVGGWVSGIGALVAAIVALKIAENQTKHEHQQSAVRCIHHSLAIINDLRGRVHYMRLMLSEGKRPLLALTRNAGGIEKRFEMLFDREIYRHVPGHIVDAITNMSGSIFGLSTLAEGIASAVNIKPHDHIPAPTDEARQPIIIKLKQIEDELDELFTQFAKVREQLV